jgi:hypothetical protein
MHDLTSDERVTCESMLANEPSSKVLVMPTHHINELGDMMGFRFVILGISCLILKQHGDQLPTEIGFSTGSHAMLLPLETRSPWCGPCSMDTHW